MSDLKSSKAKASGNKKRMPIRVPALALLVITAMTVIFIAAGTQDKVFALITGGKSNLVDMFAATTEAYSKEMEVFVSENAVLKKVMELFSKSHTQTLRTNDFKIRMSDNMEEGYFALNGSISEIPVDFELYLSDSRLVLGSSSVLYLEANPMRIGDDLFDFSDANGLGMIDDEIRGMLNLVDFSYSNLKVPAAVDPSVLPYDLVSIEQSMNKIGTALIDRAGYSMDSYTLDIRGEDVDCDLHKLSYTNKSLVNWLEKDLKAELVNNEEFEIFLNDTGNTYDTYQYGSGYDDTYENLLYEIDYMIEELSEEDDMTIIIELYANQNVLIRADLKLADSYNTYEMSFSATGSQYRLNEISFKAIEDGELLYEVIAENDLFGVDTLTSKITFLEYYYDDVYENVVDIKWDTKLSLNNFTITNTDGDYSDKINLTFMYDNDSVTFRHNQGEYPFTWQLQGLELLDVIPNPEDTVKINNANLMKIMSELEAVFGESGF